MKHLRVILAFCLAVAAASRGWSQAVAIDPGKYEVLGLRLGLSAKEAESEIAARLHVSPGQPGYMVSQGVPTFVPGRPYVSGIFVSVGGVSLGLNFAEVVPGEAKGSEVLWHIDYTPALKSDEEKKAFVARVVEKYGQPIKIFSKQDYFWAERAYDSSRAFDGANIPLLHLTTYVPVLATENPGILRHMTEVFNAREHSARPPL